MQHLETRDILWLQKHLRRKGHYRRKHFFFQRMIILPIKICRTVLNKCVEKGRLSCVATCLHLDTDKERVTSTIAYVEEKLRLFDRLRPRVSLAWRC